VLRIGKNQEPGDGPIKGYTGTEVAAQYGLAGVAGEEREVAVGAAEVDDADPVPVKLDPLERLGYCYRADNTERTKRYFREPPGAPRTHIHVRRAGSFSEQFPLLFRDYLRAHSADVAAYAQLKRRLAEQFPNDRRAYTDAKVPFSWEVIRRADDWAQQTGWEPGPSDA
jgi:GrpB-like predicted nucleotidyltransferase (UPF0157 family)